MVDSKPGALLKLARSVVTDPPRSLGAAKEIESRLLALDQPKADDLVEAFSVYSPGDGPSEPGLIGEADLIRAARHLLHDLDDHTFCVHDIPLVERP